MQICKLLQGKKLDLIWACRSRVDTLDAELLHEMKKAGCRRIYFGLESGVQEILDRVNKGLSTKKVMQTISMCRGMGIQTLGFFLVGAPGDTASTVRETLRFAKRLKLDYVQFSKCLAKPLTPLWRQMVSMTGKDYWQDWVLAKETDRALPRYWTSLTNEEIDRFARWAYISYYSSPLRLLRLTLQVRTLTEFKRKLFAFLSMIFKQEKTAKEDKAFRAFNENSERQIERYNQYLSGTYH
jgi:radical SAM superfamily enzyme YgiQ (UPF0313 family)